MKRFLTRLITITLTFALLPVSAYASATHVRVKPLYTLSNFSGNIPYDFVRFAVDRDNGEILILNPRDRDIRVFNSTGMEIYRTSPYIDLGSPVDLAVENDGTIDLLVMNGNRYTVHRCNYRGIPVSEMELTDIPKEYSDMRPSRILWNKNLLYLVDLDRLKVAVFETDGQFVRGYMIVDILGLEEKQAHESSMFGFTIDGEGNLYFTIPVNFSAYRISPDGEVTRFGESGSAPGEFSVVSGIAVDERGNIFLTDRRRSVVIVYGPNLKFLHEFGYRGFGPSNLIVPDDLVLDGTDKLYVSQARKRGVKVYRVTLENASKNN